MMMGKKLITTLTATAVLLLSGCATNRALHEQNGGYKAATSAIKKSTSTKSLPIDANPKYVVDHAFYIEKRVYVPKKHDWLRRIPYRLSRVRKPISLNAVLASFGNDGVNITTSLPMGQYQYSGYGINHTNALDALKIIIWSMGLDFKVNDNERFVTILPMETKTFMLNIGHRISAFSSGDKLSESGGGSGSSSSSSSGGSSSSSGGNAAATMPKIIQGNGIAASNDFWANLQAEVDNRCEQLVPNQSESQDGVKAAAFRTSHSSSAGGGSGSSNANSLFSTAAVCRVTMNPVSGAVTIQAPHWLMKSFTKYFHKLDEELNTSLVFQGQLILVSSTKSQSRGLDLKSFINFASSKYGLYLTNNATGGISFTPGQNGGLPNAVAGSSINGPLLGLVDNKNLSTLFSGYLSQFGQVSILQKPIIRTVSGVAGTFSRSSEVYYNVVSQSAVSSGGSSSAQVATNNQLESKKVGTFLTIFPQYDPGSGLIRADVDLTHSLETGTATQTQYITSNGSTQSVPVQIPVISNIDYNGELLMHDGQTIIIGGQVEDNGKYNDQGVPKLKNSVVGGLFGSSNNSNEVLTYYIVLKAKVIKDD